MKTMTLEVDQDDFDAIQSAVCRRQAVQCLPDGDGNLVGRIVAEICRGWSERMDAQTGKDDLSGEEWKK